MPGLYSKYIKYINALGDIAAVTASSFIAYHFIGDIVRVFFKTEYFRHLLYSLLAWLSCAALLDTYKPHRISKVLNIIVNATKVVLLYIILIEATLNIITSENISRSFLNYHYLFLFILIITWRLIIIFGLKVYRLRGYNYRKVIIAGYNNASLELQNFFQSHPEHGYRFLGIFDDNGGVASRTMGKIDDIGRYVIENEIDEIYCSPYELEKKQIIDLIEFADNNLIRLKFIPDPTGFHFKNLKVDLYDTIPVIIFRPIPLDDIINKSLKRAFDIIFSIVVLSLIHIWLIPLLALLIKLDSKGPVFFKQQRSGLDNKIFTCWKLRTMYVNNDSDNLQAKRQDSRITKIGALLRKTSLDELPQFFNVLVGHMSIVGPRPHMLKHTQEYALTVEKFMVRHLIKPGITGLSQIRGFRGDTTEMYQIKGRVKLDIFYVENWSFMLDLKIIFYTVMSVVKGDKQAF